MTYRFDDDNSTHLLTLITGHRFARLIKHATVPEKSLLAADLSLGRFNLERPTLIQSAALVCVNRHYVSAAVSIAEDKEKRAALLAGELSLQSLVCSAKKNGNGDLASHLARASDEELLEAANTVGVERIWDRMIAPLVR